MLDPVLILTLFRSCASLRAAPPPAGGRGAALTGGGVGGTNGARVTANAAGLPVSELESAGGAALTPVER